jgi:hypothetical protein
MAGAATTSVRPTCDLAGFSLAQRQNDTIPIGVASLAGVRAGQQDCYERVVFDFKDESLPTYRIMTAAPPFSGTSDMPIPVAGTGFIKVHFASTQARQFGSYTGPSAINPGFPVIKEIHLIDDFEAVVIWVIGLDKERSFRVGTLSNPTRIYIDVAT